MNYDFSTFDQKQLCELWTTNEKMTLTYNL